MTGPRRKRALLGAAVAFALLAAACSDDAAEDDADGDEAAAEGGGGGGTLAEVIDRGTLNCGINDVVPGFGFTEGDDFVGFDVDYCQAIAAAVLDDPDAVNYVPLEAAARFTSLQSGDIDVLSRNTTFTAGRDGGEGATFAATTFYDGQGMMVNADADFDDIDDLDGATICVLSGTTTELNLANRFAGMEYEPLTFGDNEEIQEAFEAGSCQGWTSDASQLAAVRSEFPEDAGGPDSLEIFDETFSKEPLGPATSDGDDQWSAVVNWVVIATLQAEEFGIDQDNLDEMLSSDDVNILRFLGQPIDPEEDEEDEGPAPFDPGLGLEPDFAARVIEAVGNYEDIWERHLGLDTSIELDREEFNDGANLLWTEGGVHYPPPYL